MQYLYHRVPKDLEGEILYPLNQLENTLPQIFKKAVQKYEGREALREVRIPFLNCLWNDVLHLTAVHPKDVKEALVEIDRSYDYEMSFFQIDPKSLEVKNAIVYLYRPPQAGFQDLYDEKNYKHYDPEEIAEYSKMPEKTKEYYKDMVNSGKSPLLYHLVPHILYKGTINTRSLEIVTV